MAELVKEIWIDATPEQVFPYLVEPELLTTWIGEESSNDPRPGGVFRLKFSSNTVSGSSWPFTQATTRFARLRSTRPPCRWRLCGLISP